MPKLGVRKNPAIPRIQTYLNLPLPTREKLERIAYQYHVHMTAIIVAAVDQFDETKHEFNNAD